MDFVFSCILGRHRVTSKIQINMNLKGSLRRQRGHVRLGWRVGGGLFPFAVSVASVPISHFGIPVRF